MSQIFSTCLWYTIATHESLRYQYFESLRFLSNLVHLSSRPLNRNLLCFEIPWSRPICSQGIPTWACLWLFPIRSFFVADILLTPSFIHFTVHSLCNAWLFCLTVDFPNQITYSIQHTLRDLVPLHFHILTFTFDCIKFFLLKQLLTKCAPQTFL